MFVYTTSPSVDQLKTARVVVVFVRYGVSSSVSPITCIPNELVRWMVSNNDSDGVYKTAAARWNKSSGTIELAGSDSSLFAVLLVF